MRKERGKSVNMQMQTTRGNQMLAAMLEEVRAHDLLTLDAPSAWAAHAPAQSAPRGLLSFWQRAQVQDAVQRSLRVAALVGIPLHHDNERAKLRDRLLIFDDQISDTVLVAWVRRLRLPVLRQFLAGVEGAHGASNVEGY